ncbi:MAG: hypothetical protein UT32_C0016G0033 [Parcubacteria group bacterium GW2011_GWC2_39_14]|nr:MAG: hypothetical protein UT32_C0016G0033 [Parcubacteria group bacterium GW2011_GWC2_39_14]KKR55103.1 MAG: hypothetical protein UT91_C0004G0002 [Parcubacteria group bacterium GW2011_GWA2_40_23]
MNQKKALAVVSVMVVVLAIAIIGFLFAKNSSTPTGSPTEVLDVTQEFPITRDFKFDYDLNVFEKENYACQIPVSEKTYVTDSNAVRLKHSFAFPWADGRGDKHTELTDMSVGFCLVEGNYKKLSSYYYGTPTTITVNGRPAQKIEMGAEGTGANQYYIWMSDETTLVVSHGYVTPFLDAALSEDSRYIPMEQQKQVFEDILISLTFK